MCLFFETFNTAEIILPIGLVTSSLNLLVATYRLLGWEAGSIAVQIVLLIVQQLEIKGFHRLLQDAFSLCKNELLKLGDCIQQCELLCHIHFFTEKIKIVKCDIFVAMFEVEFVHVW